MFTDYSWFSLKFLGNNIVLGIKLRSAECKAKRKKKERDKKKMIPIPCLRYFQKNNIEENSHVGVFCSERLFGLSLFIFSFLSKIVSVARNSLRKILGDR